MPELALHFSVVFALTAPRLGIKRALLLSLLALLPDLDVLMHVHRSMSHSILMLALVYVPVLVAVYKLKPRFSGLALLGLFALIGHLVMDCFQTYTPLLYPMLDRSLWLKVDGGLQVSPAGLKPQVSAEVKGTPTVFKYFTTMDAPVFTSEGFLISLLLVAVPLFFEVKGFGKTIGVVGGIGGTGVDGKRSSEGVSRVSGSNSLDGPVSKDAVTIVIPTLNEENGIGSVIDGLIAEGYRNILVVDGYSSDRTVEIAKSKGVDIIYQNGIGKAGAIATAIEKVSTPYMLVMDGDCTYNPRDVERLLMHAKDYDEVIGYRSDRGNIPLLHRVGNGIISLAFSLMFGKHIRDPCSGMYLLRTDVAKRLELASRGFDVEVELAGQIASLGRIGEVPVSYGKRVGEGKLNAWRDGFRILMAAVRVMWLYNPVFLFSSLLALLIVPGAIILLEQLTLRYLYGAEAWSLGWSWLGLVLFVAGLQGLTIATISLILRRMERRIIRILEGRM
ncbi:MAG: glycosyltransferase [Candidatus Bathyarchaeia archaeon]